ncbi:hypothetical protein JYK02_25225 [Corallococcus macrosporus]|uniref:Uncharacterized protein n=1 Tax=Corallococcus macrosporus TaxID=35 RepID=A0ABS3DHM6_9BACT|nr:hypothetical protein [Corallococcus macrosporus]MBN8230822.1 hypothetical protein [Corallococcus macrosporus]
MFSRPFRVLLLAVVTVLGLSAAQEVAEHCVQGLEEGLRVAAFWRLSPVEQGVVHRLAQLALYTGVGAFLGFVQSRVLRGAGFQVPGWVGMTAVGVAVGLVGSEALAGALGVSPRMAPVGMGLVLGLAQAWVLRREVYGAVVWGVACVVGYGMAGPVADWKLQAWKTAMLENATGRLSSIVITAQTMTWVALALSMVIGGLFIFTSLRAQVLPAAGSRLPGAMGQLTFLGLALPLMVALEARQSALAPKAGPGCVLRSIPVHDPEPAPAPVRTRRAPSEEGFSPGCAGRGCGPARTYEAPSQPPAVLPDHRQARTVHDEHLFVLTATEKLQVPASGRRWNNRASTEAEPINAASGAGADQGSPAHVEF